MPDEHDGAGEAVAPALGRRCPLPGPAYVGEVVADTPSAGSRCCPPIPARVGRRAPATSPHRGARNPRRPARVGSRRCPRRPGPDRPASASRTGGRSPGPGARPRAPNRGSPASSAAAVSTQTRKPASGLSGCCSISRRARLSQPEPIAHLASQEPVEADAEGLHRGSQRPALGEEVLMALLGDRHGLLDQTEPPGGIGHGVQVVRGQGPVLSDRGQAAIRHRPVASGVRRARRGQQIVQIWH